jgi:hypothetical protein
MPVYINAKNPIYITRQNYLDLTDKKYRDFVQSKIKEGGYDSLIIEADEKYKGATKLREESGDIANLLKNYSDEDIKSILNDISAEIENID